MRRREKENEKGENPSKSSDARLCVGGLAPVWHCGVVWVTQQVGLKEYKLISYNINLASELGSLLGLGPPNIKVKYTLKKKYV